ncbi:MAG: SAM hydrolase/SAM-dependent halogenase family protein [Candidatus Hodarchaeales archaeon]
MVQIALFTDFGIKDTYVGVMKGIIQKIAPNTSIIDLTHQIPSHNILNAAFNLMNSYIFFPENTVFCCIVDPGVGTLRKAIAITTNNKYTFIAPDNGLLTGIIIKEKIKLAVELNNPQYHLEKVTSTFHGRDIFAPVAAYITTGVPLKTTGSELNPSKLIQLDNLLPKRKTDSIEAIVIHIDNFGNIITNIPEKWLTKSQYQHKIYVGSIVIEGIKQTFADVDIGKSLAYIGSYGYLELGVRNGNAHQLWNIDIGETITVV